ncbi:response regulator [Kitasatospora cathayae]|uniref:Response regulator n=1 Tax=Kitasatospora cathayae TaxID=3004092 RepID=A0ABY7PXR7_9ACTN|nr:response regulator [Kitasatospora sp. HUAS 3-15]WBP85166.1 response regulator [Kitasatospora sp. HUAS 3-15]
MNRILLVDDDPLLLRTLQLNLRARQYEVLTANSGRAALDAAERDTPDAVLLDLGLPDLDGIDVLRHLRAHLDVPIIVLSGRTEPEEMIRALDAGADDYVTKPFDPDELFARLRAVLRRPSRLVREHNPRIGEYEIDTDATTATGPSGPVRLTPIEWKILTLLLANPGHLVSGRQILREVWGPTAEKQRHYLRVYLAGLRRKLEPDPAHPRHLITEAGMGYRYEP